MSGSQALATLAAVWPDEAIAVVEAPSSTVAARNRLRLSRPGSWYATSSGGLGFGISAAVGVQLAQPQRPVVAILGEGSAQYGITALWTATAYRVPVTFLVLRNQEYSILKWFSQLEQVERAPGLDLPQLDVAAVAQGYGMQARTASPDSLEHELRTAIAQNDGPALVQVDIASGMWME
jgi:benzoylformate decarboxylase